MLGKGRCIRCRQSRRRWLRCKETKILLPRYVSVPKRCVAPVFQHTTIDGCTIKDNNGGGIGGVSVFPKATATIVDSTVCGNVGYKGDTTQIYGDYTDNGGNTIEDECPAECAPDINGDGTVNVSDLLQLIGAWGPCGGCDEDIDDSGEVDVTDLLMAIASWGDCDG